ncbi:MAG: hypothetical protein FWH12_08400 [Treponema sp.]|nr:hypothetical protein [Treponema sp.]
MNEPWNYEHCVLVLSAEIEIVKKIFILQDRVRQAVMGREWADFDEKLAELNRFGEEFSLLEEKREVLFASLGEIEGSQGSSEGSEKPFYALLMGLPLNESRELSRLYRELKMETLKMKALNDSFLVFLNEAKVMATTFLEVLHPERGGKLYTRKGSMAAHDLKSIVINNQF